MTIARPKSHGEPAKLSNHSIRALPSSLLARISFTWRTNADGGNPAES